MATTVPSLQGPDSNHLGASPEPGFHAPAIRQAKADHHWLTVRSILLVVAGSSRIVGNHENLAWAGCRDRAGIMAEGSADVAATIAELQALLRGTESIAGFLYEMAMLAAGTLGGSPSCGITLQTNGRPLTVASSDHWPHKWMSCSTG